MRKILLALALVALGTLPLAAQQPVYQGPFFYKNITTDSTFLLKAGPGMLHCVNINAPTATTTIKLYDGLTASGTLFASYTIAASPSPSSVCYDVQFGVGLTVVTGTATSDITVSFR